MSFSLQIYVIIYLQTIYKNKNSRQGSLELLENEMDIDLGFWAKI